MADYPLTVPEILTAATMATPRTRSVLARARQRSSLLCLRALVRMIAILRRRDAGQCRKHLSQALRQVIGPKQKWFVHTRSSRPLRSSLNGLRTSHFIDGEFAPIWRTVARLQLPSQSTRRPAAIDDTIVVMS
jgi:hypothetical protein